MRLQNIMPNFHQCTVSGKDLFFSYETLIAFRTSESDLIVCENVWSRTTGKHLNYLCDKKDRIVFDKFEGLKEKYL